MSNFREATRKKLRFNTSVGQLSTEQLWDLSLNQLDTLAVQLQEDYKESGKKSFLVAKSQKDKDVKLQFDIVIDILSTKVDENKAASDGLKDKAHNQKILDIIALKTDEELAGKSVDELKKMLKK
jgi:hypothetical protein